MVSEKEKEAIQSSIKDKEQIIELSLIGMKCAITSKEIEQFYKYIAEATMFLKSHYYKLLK